jgi:oligoendopeptidase F
MRIIVAAALAVASSLAIAQADPNRWNLADLYADTAAWNADATKLEAQLKEVAACKGHLGDGVKKFKQCSDEYWDANKRLNRLGVYAGELFADDTSAAAGLELQQKIQILGSQFGEAASYVQPEILKLGRKKIDAYLKQDKSLQILRHVLDDILRQAPHTLDEKGEAIVATFGLTSDTSQSIYTILATADLPWPTLKIDGKEVRLDQAAYTKHRANADRDVRKKVMDSFFGKWKEYEHTFGATLYSRLKQSTVYSRVRKYPDSLAASLDGGNVPPAVYDTLIRETNANLGTLHRYFKLRAKLLDLKEMRYYDIYPPIVKSDLKFPIEKGREIMLQALKPLGDDYVAVVEKGLKDRWMDVHPRPKKLPGAHMAGDAYDVHPYVLMNYNDDYEGVTTLNHEWGHAIHTYLANKAQPYPTAGYPIFTAEIASTVNEALLLDHVLKSARTDDERLYYLGFALELLRATFYRQAMFAEFERAMHRKVDEGGALTGEQFTKMYCDILKRYHGHDQGVVKIDDAYCLEWAYIPHFYNPYYVYQYATSLAAGAQFADGILANKPGARESYLDLLRAGGSDYPYELVKKAGVDLATAAPYQALVARMNRIMEQIEAILAKR